MMQKFGNINNLKQGGQALAEVLIAMLALIPLYWAITTLGKFLDFDHAGRQATRYVNWEQTVGKPMADIVNNQEVMNRFLRAPLGGLDPNIINQPLLNPLWQTPALNRPNGDYYLVDPNVGIVINVNNIAAAPLTNVPNNLAPYDANTAIQAITLSIPLDTMPWELSAYPPATAQSPQVMQYNAALLSDSFIPTTEAGVANNMPAAQTFSALELAAREPPITGMQTMWFGFRIAALLPFINLPSSYPYAEIWDNNEVDFFRVTPNSAILPATGLQL